MTIITPEEFKAVVSDIEATEGYRKPLAWAIGKVITGQVNPEKVLTVSFPVINWNCNFGSFAILYKVLGLNTDSNEISVPLDMNTVEDAFMHFAPFLEEAVDNKHKNVQVLKLLTSLVGAPNASQPLIELGDYRLIAIFEDTEVKSAEAAYLKLMALSHGLVPLRSLNLNGVFGSLTNVAWIGTYPVELEYLRQHELQLKLTGEWPKIDYVDKFPRYLDHVIPADNTRILDTSKVRFGAQLAAGTTVMPGASYINFNAGTEGPVMVEGRISSSAKVGAGSDVGGGASILGVLSGGNSDPITIGENTLLGANSVCGISLGDGCILDAGCTILAGTKVNIIRGSFDKLREVNQEHSFMKKWPLASHIDTVTGRELAGMNGLHIRQDSISGLIIAFRSVREIKLNADLH